jgi:hypothetical protein
VSFVFDIHLISSQSLDSLDPDLDTPVPSLLTGEAAQHEAESADRRIQKDSIMVLVIRGVTINENTFQDA